MKRLLTSTSPLLLTFVARASAAVACTVTTSSTPDGSSSSSSSSSSSGSSGDGDGGSSSGSSGGEADAKIGTISMTQTSFTAGPTTIDSYSLIASFATGGTAVGSGGEGTKCNTAKDGDCTVTDCDLSPTDAGSSSGGVSDAGTPKQKHAGDITVAADLDVTMTPDDNGSYPYKTGQVKLFGSEQEIAVDAKGADIPAFSTTLKAPTFVTLTEPAWPAPGQPLAVNRANALAFKWDAGTSGDVMVSLSTVSSTKLASVSCTWKASAGQGSIGAAALGKLTTDGQGSIAVNASSTSTVTAGDWKVNVSALSPAKAGSSLASGQITVQ